MTFNRDQQGLPIGVTSTLLRNFSGRLDSGQARYNLIHPEKVDELDPVVAANVVANNDDNKDAFDRDMANILVVPQRQFVYQGEMCQVVRSQPMVMMLVWPLR